MSRTEHLIVYRPTEEIINRILDCATLVEEWSIPASPDMRIPNSDAEQYWGEAS